jgi:hypothetical protein
MSVSEVAFIIVHKFFSITFGARYAMGRSLATGEFPDQEFQRVNLDPHVGVMMEKKKAWERRSN